MGEMDRLVNVELEEIEEKLRVMIGEGPHRKDEFDRLLQDRIQLYKDVDALWKYGACKEKVDFEINVDVEVKIKEIELKIKELEAERRDIYVKIQNTEKFIYDEMCRQRILIERERDLRSNSEK